MTTTKKTRCLATLVVDRSGSMLRMKDEAEAGVNNYIADQAKIDNAKVKVMVCQFDDRYEHVFGPVKAADAPTYMLHPRNMTALYDAIGKGIEDTRNAIKTATKKPDKVVLVVMTDGFENASQEHTHESVLHLVDQVKANGWHVVFLAGNLEAVQWGQRIGVNTTSYNPAVRGQTMSTYAAASTATSHYFAGDADNVDTPDVTDDSGGDS